MFFVANSANTSHTLMISGMLRVATSSGEEIRSLINDPDKGRNVQGTGFYEINAMRMFEIKSYNPVPLFFMNIKLR